MSSSVSSFTFLLSLDFLQDFFKVRVCPNAHDYRVCIAAGLLQRCLRRCQLMDAVELTFAYLIDQDAEVMAQYLDGTSAE